ncbi:hypothetical protein FB45DRAFT_898236 [Roridomyces roridus]|uniref:N-acetyltransferase domain-containing protein n=1 Tax=Roridomyces roridus TaxID=1738132 RepID=A0AAD7CBW0_9AGAR|nr:hypothetical protein FB45DRAFT_898236 [Roridomyces roridus]
MSRPPYIRVATVDDLDELASMTQRAFISSPAQSYLANLRLPLTTAPKDTRARENQVDFIKYLIRRAWHLQGRITVVVLPCPPSTPRAPQRDANKEQIIACSVWRPPVAGAARKSPSGINDLRLGLLGLLSSWGLGLTARIAEFVQPIERAFQEGWKHRNLPTNPDGSWHLQLAGVDPEFQGQGYMSMLLLEAFQNAGPKAIFTLEATTPRARDIYTHFGFEIVKEVVIGKGKVDAHGIAASGESAVGFPVYPMIRTGR